jgi:hypothetical protein
VLVELITIKNENKNICYVIPQNKESVGMIFDLLKSVISIIDCSNKHFSGAKVVLGFEDGLTTIGVWNLTWDKKQVNFFHNLISLLAYENKWRLMNEVLNEKL